MLRWNPVTFRTLLLALLAASVALAPFAAPAAPSALPCKVDPAGGDIACQAPECPDCVVPARPLPGANACRGNAQFSFTLHTARGANGFGTPAGTPDTVWRLASHPTLNAPSPAISLGINPIPVTWVSDPPSSWINPYGVPGAPDPYGDYVYEATYFVPPGAQGVTLTGRYAADNEATLSDADAMQTTPLDVSPPNAFGAWRTIPPGPFLSGGVHTLTFWVRNVHDSSPAGLNAQITVSGDCPPVRGGACRGLATTFSIPLNTGIDAAGNPLPPSLVDPFWTTAYSPGSGGFPGPGGAAYSHGIWPFGGWVFDPASAWINANPFYVDDAVGTWGYQVLYHLPPNAYDVYVTGNVSADNDAVLSDTDFLTQTIFVAQTPTPFAYTGWTPFHEPITTNGLHAFTAKVYNDGGPTGLNVVGAVTGKCRTVIDLGPVEKDLERLLG